MRSHVALLFIALSICFSADAALDPTTESATESVPKNLPESQQGVVIYSMPNCLGCVMVKSLFDTKGIPFNEINVVTDRAAYEEMKIITGKKTVPRVFINGEYIGGYSETASLDLDKLVTEKKPSAQN